MCNKKEIKQSSINPHINLNLKSYPMCDVGTTTALDLLICQTRKTSEYEQ